MGMYDADKTFWSGLTSGGQYRLQKGMRVVSRGIGEVQFIPSDSGYDGWEEVAESVILRKPKKVLFGGHSNGLKACTYAAQAIEPYGIRCAIIGFDATLGHIAKLGSNVDFAVDIHAGFQTLKTGPDFRGDLHYFDFRRESHVGVSYNKQALDLAIQWGREYFE